MFIGKTFLGAGTCLIDLILSNWLHLFVPCSFLLSFLRSNFFVSLFSGSPRRGWISRKSRRPGEHVTHFRIMNCEPNIIYSIC